MITLETTVAINAKMTFNERHLRALDALVGYGTDNFLNVFYEKLGTSYLKPYEQELRELFSHIKCEVPTALGDIERVRKELLSEKAYKIGVGK